MSAFSVCLETIVNKIALDSSRSKTTTSQLRTRSTYGPGAWNPSASALNPGHPPTSATPVVFTTSRPETVRYPLLRETLHGARRVVPLQILAGGLGHGSASPPVPRLFSMQAFPGSESRTGIANAFEVYVSSRSGSCLSSRWTREKSKSARMVCPRSGINPALDAGCRASTWLL
ncbi:uncharacterized protein M421DRAFT_140501 [Didymella exigua CBS 183.55]|uniref:Uncharacterized protein n=1 Tax=Didymella exigua CBS 183.55 TaxID=1150837 RepID=A0A6A5RN11_9PLEO|nr:uncharacterized protein M421DRAFT_140501 [Didymella exigua CBS 183.55]KAF1928823.1 hypothetical protein M421DRAFT_140501 [Didymella exigua CBS 183.55]